MYVENWRNSVKKLFIPLLLTLSIAASNTSDWTGVYVVTQDMKHTAGVVHSPATVVYMTTSKQFRTGESLRINFDIDGLSFTKTPLVINTLMSQAQFEKALEDAGLQTLTKKFK